MSDCKISATNNTNNVDDSEDYDAEDYETELDKYIRNPEAFARQEDEDVCAAITLLKQHHGMKDDAGKEGTVTAPSGKKSNEGKDVSEDGKKTKTDEEEDEDNGIVMYASKEYVIYLPGPFDAEEREWLLANKEEWVRRHFEEAKAQKAKEAFMEAKSAEREAAVRAREEEKKKNLPKDYFENKDPDPKDAMSDDDNWAKVAEMEWKLQLHGTYRTDFCGQCKKKPCEWFSYLAKVNVYVVDEMKTTNASGRLLSTYTHAQKKEFMREHRFALYSICDKVRTGGASRGYGNRVPFPPCVEKEIRGYYPDPDGDYSGFKSNSRK